MVKATRSSVRVNAVFRRMMSSKSRGLGKITPGSEANAGFLPNSSKPRETVQRREQRAECALELARLPKVLLIGPSLRIMGGQAVMADSLMRGMRGDGVDIDFLPINPQPPGILRHTEKVKYLRTVIVSFFYVVSLLRRIRRYDLVHLFSAAHASFMVSQMPAILIARWYGKPLILNYRSGEAEDHLRRWGRNGCTSRGGG